AVTQAGSIETVIAALVGGYNRDPFAILGPHTDDQGRGVVIRAFQPAARQIDLRLASTGEIVPMEKRDAGGLYEPRVESRDGSLPDYRLRITYPCNHTAEIDDAYRYGRV